MKIDQRLRVGITRDGDSRVILDIWRIADDYYATPPKLQGHQSYHAKGRTHLKGVNAWGEDIYHDVEYKTVPREIEGIEEMYLGAFLNEDVWHGDQSTLKRLKVRAYDSTLLVDGNQYPDACGFIFLVGLASDEQAINNYINNVLKIDNQYEIIASTSLEAAHEKRIYGIIARALDAKPPMATAGIAVLDRGLISRSRLIRMFMARKMTAPKPLPKPAPLAIRVEDWMPRTQFKLSFPLGSHRMILGPLHIEALRCNTDYGLQPIVINPNLIHLHAASYAFANDDTYVFTLGHRWPNTENSAFLLFSYGRHGGQAIHQVRIDGIDYQIEMLGTGGQRFNKNGEQVTPETISDNDIWNITYDMEIICLSRYRLKDLTRIHLPM